MKKKNLAIAALLPLVAATSIASSLNNKQLAGPPEEFEFMQKALPHQSAIKSKSALLPVTLNQTKSGNWVWESNIAVDSNDFSFVLFNNNAKNWDIELRNPVTNQSVKAEQLANRVQSTKFGLEDNTHAGERFDFNNIDSGNWNINIRTKGEPDQREGFILLSNKSPYQLSTYKTNHDQIVDHKIHFVTQATSNENTIEALKKFNPINSAYMLVTAPNGEKSKIAMFDDGQHGDLEPNDGIFGGDFTAEKAGGYSVQIHAQGRNPNKTNFYRTTEHFVPIIEQSILLNHDKAIGFALNDKRLNVELSVESTEKAKSDDRFRVIAEVWGASTTKKGEMEPVSWISTITNVNDGLLDIELDSRWISLAKTQAPFELRNLRIEDANHFIPLIESEHMELKVDSLPKLATKSFDGDIDNEMLMGTPPENFNQKASGSKLLLVHGYCSGDAWGPVQGQFSNADVFEDFNQNRSHDTFANLIKNYGSQYNSFGVVAHSQGGAASLHLYTYYWSGLDYASGGSRLIQSVGTPFQGTPLAGNLAALGNVFGAGCGYNSNLTTSGASSWLSGIPTWARNQVNYHTTSFATKWWRNDYCNFATDLFLSDPEDGTTEKSRGQLSGGSNRGHKTGWCHTTSMRDPGQTTDSSRNVSMSNYAKR